MSRSPAGRESFVRRTAIGVPVAVIGLLALPMVLTSRSFGHDWTLHLWLIRQQQLNIEATGHPGLFISIEELGAFYPMFAFVGSGIYSVGGYLAIVLGDRPVLAYKLLYISGLCIAYGGMTWLSVQRGLRGWRSQIPGLVFVTGAYYVTQILGIGDLGEFMALSAIPLLLAAGCAILTGSAPRARCVVALLVAVFVLTGSNNITLAWGSVFLVLLALLALAAFGPTWPRPLPWRRVGTVIGVGALGAGLNAWYLFPDVAYGLDTIIARENRDVLPLTLLESPGLLLNPLRTSDPGHHPLAADIRLTLPWMFIAWALVMAYMTWRGRDGATKRFFAGLVAIGCVYFALAVAKTPWRLVPHPLYNIQFTRRLHAYLLLATALAVMIVLERQQATRARTKRVSTTVLALISVFSVGAATWQVWRVRSQYHVVGADPVRTDENFDAVVVAARTVVPPSWYVREEFRDGTANKVATEPERVLTVPVTAVNGEKFSGVLDVPDGPAPFRTNISGGPQFVRMDGIRAVGTTRRGLVVAVRSRDAPPVGPITVTIEPARSAVIRTGSIVTLVSIVACIALLLWPLRERFGRRRPIGTVNA